MEVYFSLGSNLGDRRVYLDSALDLLDRKLGVCRTVQSSYLETEPWGFKSKEKFLNAAVRYDLPSPWKTDFLSGKNVVRENSVFVEARESGHENAILAIGLHLLDICKEIEKELGRRQAVLRDEQGNRVYSDRPIDIDILFMGKERLDSERLTVPHPLIAERDFVLIPLKEILSDDIRLFFPEIFRQK